MKPQLCKFVLYLLRIHPDKVCHLFPSFARCLTSSVTSRAPLTARFQTFTYLRPVTLFLSFWDVQSLPFPSLRVFNISQRLLTERRNVELFLKLFLLFVGGWFFCTLGYTQTHALQSKLHYCVEKSSFFCMMHNFRRIC